MADLTLTVIGCSAAAPRAGGASSSYLVAAGETRVLLDCGPGSLSFLRKEINPRNLDAIVLSHLHADHTLDLIPLCYLLKYGPLEGDEQWVRDRPLPLIVPPGGEAFLTRLGGALEGDGGEGFWSPFAIRTYDPHGTETIGGIAIRFAPTKHYIPCNAMRITPANAATPVLVYGADSAPVETLTTLAHGADLLILEATLPEPEKPAPVGHMSPAEAGTLATAAGGVKHLLLTHYWGVVPTEQMAAEARAVFSGVVNVAVEHASYPLAGS